MKTIKVRGIQGAMHTAIVSDEDFLFVSRWAWKLNNSGYVKRNVTARKEGSQRTDFLYMHRAIAERAGVDLSHEIDHINRNKLDNRRENLRSAQRWQNCVNSGPKRTSTTGVKGVSVDRTRGGFIAMIRFNGKRKNLGRFATVAEAGAAYSAAAAELHGEFAHA